MRLFILIWIFFSAFSIATQAQQKGDTTLVIPGTYDYFAVDNLENIYVFTTAGQLKKLNSKGDSIAVYNNVKRFGTVSSIDVSNPLNIIIFYKGQNKIVFLDQYLSVRNSIALVDAGIYNASAACLAFDGGAWVYDNFNNQIKKISAEGKSKILTVDFRQLFNHSSTITTLVENNKLIYAYDPTQGIYVFDFYGSSKSFIPIRHWRNISIENNMISGWMQQYFEQYNSNTKSFDKIEISNKIINIKQALLTTQNMWILDEGGLQKINNK